MDLGREATNEEEGGGGEAEEKEEVVDKGDEEDRRILESYGAIHVADESGATTKKTKTNVADGQNGAGKEGKEGEEAAWRRFSVRSAERSTATKSRLEAVGEAAGIVLEDVRDDLRNVSAVARAFDDWRRHWPSEYKETYASLALPDLLAPYVRLTHLGHSMEHGPRYLKRLLGRAEKATMGTAAASVRLDAQNWYVSRERVKGGAAVCVCCVKGGGSLGYLR